MTESANHIKDETIPPSSSVTTSGATQSLLDYYSAPKSDPRAFLRAWAKTSEKTLDEEHRKIVLQKFSELDPSFERTEGLAIKAFVSPSIAAAFFPWIGRVIQEVLTIEKGWSYDPSREGLDTFLEIARYLREYLVPSKAKTKNERQLAKKRSDRAAKILLASMLWLSYSRNLRVVDAIQAIKDMLVSRVDDADEGRQADRVALASIAHSKISQQRLREVIQLLSPWYGRIGGLKSQLAAQNTEMEVLQRSLVKTEETARTRAEAIAGLEGESQRLKTEVEQLRGQVNDHQITGRHGRMEVVTRERGLLSGKLKPLLQSAKAAAELMPPRAQVVMERLELAIEAIDQEDQWLQSSD